MKKQILLLSLLHIFFFTSNSYSQDTIISFGKYTENKFDMYVSTAKDIVEVNIKLANIEVWSNNEGQLGSIFGHYFEESGNYIELTSEGLMRIYDEGKPNIPVLSRLIYYPLKFVNVSYKVLGYDEEIIDLATMGFNEKIFPAQPSISKSNPPDKFYIDTITYSEDKYYNEGIAVFEYAGILRDVQIGRIEIRPIQYNPVQNKLRILNNLTFQAVFSVSLKIQDVEIQEFDLYPNPCNSYINISFPDLDNEIKYIQMFDISGKLIYEENTNQNSLQINMSSYNQGIYFIRIVSNKSEYKHKIIKI